MIMPHAENGTGFLTHKPHGEEPTACQQRLGPGLESVGRQQFHPLLVSREQRLRTLQAQLLPTDRLKGLRPQRPWGTP